MTNRVELHRQALRAAMRQRVSLGYRLEQPICIFELISRVGLETRFVPAPSLEGVYSPEDLAIVLSSLRPSGRQRFTAAHELGHHVFRHGVMFEELREAQDTVTPEEILADSFAAYLLMPRLAVVHAFHRRGILPVSASPRDIYAISGAFGVGYETLIKHMYLALELITPNRARLLLRTGPAHIRAELLGTMTPTELFLADKHWTGRPIDLQVADTLLLPSTSLIDLPRLTSRTGPNGTHVYTACQPGIVQVADRANNWSSFVRISRRDYVGSALHRYQEDPDHDS